MHELFSYIGTLWGSTQPCGYGGKLHSIIPALAAFLCYPYGITIGEVHEMFSYRGIL